MAVELAIKVVAIGRFFGGILQTDVLTLLGIHSTKLLQWTKTATNQEKRPGPHKLSGIKYAKSWNVFCFWIR